MLAKSLLIVCISTIFFNWTQTVWALTDSTRLVRKLERLEEAKEDYARVRDESVQAVVHSIDGMKAQVESARIPVQLQSQAIDDLNGALSEFESKRTFVKIPALQQVYRRYVLSNVAAYGNLMRSYDAVLKELPTADSRRKEFRQEVKQHIEESADFDSLKVGRKFVGYRNDFNWGPVRNISYSNSIGVIKLTKVKNKKVKVEFTLQITKREGSFVEGVVTQNDGRFRAIVQGTYNGSQLKMKMVHIKRGPDRYFEYQGEVIGNLGLIMLRGIKTNKVKTTGKIFLEAR